MTERIIIRQETPDDFKEVFEVNRSAFGQNNEAALVDHLRRNPAVFVPGLSLVAVGSNKIVGHILFTRIKINDGNGTMHESLGLAPMAVRPGFQKRGIGGQLIKKGFEASKKSGFKSVIVLGHENYYPKFGFEPARKWNIKAPVDVSPGAFMAIELVKDGLKDVSGTVVYPKEFTAV